MDRLGRTAFLGYGPELRVANGNQNMFLLLVPRACDSGCLPETLNTRQPRIFLAYRPDLNVRLVGVKFRMTYLRRAMDARRKVIPGLADTSQ